MNKKSAFIARAQLSQKTGSETENNVTNATVVAVILGVGSCQPLQTSGQDMSQANNLTLN